MSIFLTKDQRKMLIDSVVEGVAEIEGDEYADQLEGELHQLGNVELVRECNNYCPEEADRLLGIRLR
jgi:hypothetical protein